MRLGVEVLLEKRRDLLKDKKVGLIVNPSSIDHSLNHTASLFLENSIDVKCLFSPEHGISADLQDQVECGDTRDPITRLPVFSLYGETRVPTQEMCEEIDVFAFDIQDVGTRVYTYIYTMAHCMMAAAKYDKDFVVLDRPNPINGVDVEGNVLEENFSSFVGLYPIPMRHGMTTGELARLFNEEFGIGCNLEVIEMEGWKREMWFDETGLPWVSPSPNMATLDTATVYPGTVLVEGINLSEGRGTTHPFEMAGAPWVDPACLVESLEEDKLPGVKFRPLYFRPTFGKYKDEICGGIQIHVIDRERFRPFKSGICVIRTVYDLWTADFGFLSPPYEYEYEKSPFDILCGTSMIRRAFKDDLPIEKIEKKWQKKLTDFLELRTTYLMY